MMVKMTHISANHNISIWTYTKTFMRKLIEYLTFKYLIMSRSHDILHVCFLWFLYDFFITIRYISQGVKILNTTWRIQPQYCIIIRLLYKSNNNYYQQYDVYDKSYWHDSEISKHIAMVARTHIMTGCKKNTERTMNQ